MAHPFDALEPADIRDPRSIKWNRHPGDVLPLWVADMDFPVAPQIRAALEKRAHEWLGYPLGGGDPELLDAIIALQHERGWPGLEPRHLWLVPGVVPGLYAAIAGLTSPGDEVITHTPIYPPFLTAITDHGRVARPNPLTRTPDGYRLDMAHLETLVTPATRALMLCNPHNPTGRVWTRAELETLAEFALRHRLWVISDELHADLILDGQFTPFASLGHDVAARTLTFTGPCKTYNTAGLGIGVAISENEAILDRVRRATRGLLAHPNVMSMAMWHAGLTGGRAWLEDTLAYLRANRDFLTAYLREHLSGVEYVGTEGTYLAWLDFRAYPFADRVQQHLLDAGVGLNDGPPFGPDAQGFVRLNFATSRRILEEALDRIARACTT